MEHFFNHLLKNKIFVLLTVLSTVLSIPSFSQVGFNNPNPDSTALIDMKANDKGLLIPRMTTTQRALMTVGGRKVAHALLIFDTDRNMFFFYDTTSTPDRWIALNPWVSEGEANSDVNIVTTGNVGINTPGNPTAKLDVNGAIKSNGNITATGNIVATGNVSSNTVTATGNISSGSVTTGNVNSTGSVTATAFFGNGVIPLGGIIMWSGATPPTGWALCDGLNGTPNLTGRFVVGTGNFTENTITYSYPIGAVGGEVKHTLSLGEMPAHNHSFDIAEFFSDESESGTSGGGFQTGGGWTTISTDTKGSSQAHENRPPYYALAYIMRIQ